MQNTMIKTIFTILTLLCVTATTLAQQHVPSKVDIAWNRMYDYAETTAILRKLVDAYPDLLSMRSLGESVEGREMWLVILNNDETGAHDEKPAMYIDANIHGNEVQSTEVVLYTIWYLTKSYGELDPLTELIDRASFYFVPMVNPDSRDHWFHNPNTAHSQRSGQRPTDNDYDGLKDEDAPDDIDGDGNITRMWRFDPNGRFRRNRDDPRIIERVPEGEKGNLEFAGWEGYDNDGDGRVNEDGPGGYDMNRNWPSGWQPDYIQYGAGDHPLSFPETRSIAMFILDHPNIAAGQSYHNSGGMILRGPGAAYRDNLYPRGDRRVYGRLGEAGEQMLPFYDYMIIHSDLYTVHGGTVNWLAEGLGIVSYTNELWTTDRLMKRESGRRLDDELEMRWHDRLLFGQAFTDWTEHEHPTYGKVLIGGTSQYWGRTPPPFMREEEHHRNFAFTAFHADQMPNLSFTWIEARQMDDELWRVTVEVENDRIIPTRLDLASQKDIGQPDRFEVFGDRVDVVAGGTVDNRFEKSMDAVEHEPDVIHNDAGIGSESTRLFRFIIQAREGRRVTLHYTAEKARDIKKTIRLEEGTHE